MKYVRALGLAIGALMFSTLASAAQAPVGIEWSVATDHADDNPPNAAKLGPGVTTIVGAQFCRVSPEIPDAHSGYVTRLLACQIVPGTFASTALTCKPGDEKAAHIALTQTDGEDDATTLRVFIRCGKPTTPPKPQSERVLQ